MTDRERIAALEARLDDLQEQLTALVGHTASDVRVDATEHTLALHAAGSISWNARAVPRLHELTDDVRREVLASVAGGRVVSRGEVVRPVRGKPVPPTGPGPAGPSHACHVCGATFPSYPSAERHVDGEHGVARVGLIL